LVEATNVSQRILVMELSFILTDVVTLMWEKRIGLKTHTQTHTHTSHTEEQG
jgi:hypothetical protein